jgi:hypothetical protein
LMAMLVEVASWRPDQPVCEPRQVQRGAGVDRIS